MTFEVFAQLHTKLINSEIDIGKTKAKEYTDGQDRLLNFKESAKKIGISNKQVLLSHLDKQLASIYSFVRNDRVLSESIYSRIVDARLYLALLMALVQEEQADATK